MVNLRGKGGLLLLALGGLAFYFFSRRQKYDATPNTGGPQNFSGIGPRRKAQDMNTLTKAYRLNPEL